MKLFLLLLSFSFFLSCHKEIPVPKDHDLKVIIERELPLTNAIGIEFDFRNDDGNWDYLTVIGSNSNMKSIEEKLNINLDRIQTNPIWHTDSLNLIIYINDQKLVKIIELNRKTGDFEKYAELIPRAKAILRTTKTGELIFGN